MNLSSKEKIPLVSVLLPISRLDNYFGLALKSILDQTFTDYEILVLANGLSDGDFFALSQICLIDKRIALHRLEVSGLMFALNYGINISNSEFIARMDADDISYPNRLEVQTQFLKRNADVDVVGGRIDLIDGNGLILKKNYRYFESHDEIVRVLPYRNPLCHPALIFRRSALLKVWGYRFGFMSEDHEMFIRMMYAGLRFHNINQKIFAYRRHDKQITDSGKSRVHFAEISSFMWMNFYNKKRMIFLVGAIAVYPTIRSIRSAFGSILIMLENSIFYKFKRNKTRNHRIS